MVRISKNKIFQESFQQELLIQKKTKAHTFWTKFDNSGLCALPSSSQGFFFAEMRNSSHFQKQGLYGELSLGHTIPAAFPSYSCHMPSQNQTLEGCFNAIHTGSFAQNFFQIALHSIASANLKKSEDFVTKTTPA